MEKCLRCTQLIHLWSCKYYGKEINYDPEEYPNAQKHCDTHFGMTEPLRAPNNEKVAELVGIGIKKVIDYIKEIGTKKFIEKI
ncbi:MAG: hypothetical protein NC915_03230 [Candidatus Omnitrophica bacterium]|nr:hypothetical protein [Candidatus Omnitrophota bacterium]